MRMTGWLLVVLGLLGLAACAVGGIAMQGLKSDLSEGTSAVVARAQGLLDEVDAKLEGLPARLDALAASREPGLVLDGLHQVQGGLHTAREMATSILTLLRAATALQPGEESEDRFPVLVGVTATLTEFENQVHVQTENAEAWTLKFDAIKAGITSVRESVAETRKDAQRFEADAHSGLGTIALLVIVFLAWMALGQLTLAHFGWRRGTARSAT